MMATISVSCHCEEPDCNVCNNGHMAITDSDGTRYPHRNFQWILSTSNKWHILDKDDRYLCNKAVGKFALGERPTMKLEQMFRRMHHARCKNCLSILKKVL